MADRLERREFLARSLKVAGGAAVVAGTGSGLLGAVEQLAPAPAAAASGLDLGVKPRQGGTLRIGMGADVNSLDPTQANWTTTGLVYGNAVLDPLAGQAPDGTAQPYLAQSIIPNADFTEWRITVRPNIKFHDGSPLDGQAVAANFEARLTSPTGKETLSNVASVTVADPNTCVVTLHGPQSSFASSLTYQTGYIVSPQSIQNGTAAHHPVGTGPFVFDQWVPDVKFTATRNPHYWRPGLPHVDQIVVQPFADDTSQMNTLLAGQLDVIASTDTEVYLELKNNHSVDVVDDLSMSVGEPNVTYVGLNLASAPTSDLRVRQALAYATNNKEVLQLVYGGVGTVASGPFFPGSPYYSPTGYPGFNLAKAKKLVADYKRDNGSLTVPLLTTTDAQPKRLAQVLQSMWNAAGISTTISAIEDASYIIDVFDGKFSACYFQALQAATPDQNYIFWSPTASAPLGSIAINFVRNTDPKVEAALQTARRSGSPAVQANAYKALAREFGATLPYLWLTRAVTFDASQASVANVVGSTFPSGTRRLLPINWIAPGEAWLKI